MTGIPATGADVQVGQTFDWAPGRFTLTEVQQPNLTHNGKPARYVNTTDTSGRPVSWILHDDEDVTLVTAAAVDRPSP
jgi:hypothetical protein